MLVIDSSFVIALMFEEEHTAFVIERMEAVSSSGLAAPALLNWEIANVLRNKVLRKQVSAQDADARLDSFMRLSIGFPDREATPAVLLNMALGWDLTAYDVSYVELAIRLAAPIATLDRNMAKVGTDVGLVVHSPFA